MTTQNQDETTVWKKDALYAPLHTYENGEISGEEDFKLKKWSDPRRKVGKQLKTAALIDFVVHVSKHAHEHHSMTTGLNNGNRPLSSNIVDASIRERSLTLVSGYNSAAVKGDERKPENPSISNRKRKRLLGEPPKVFPYCDEHGETLKKLNIMWNEYIISQLKWGARGGVADVLSELRIKEIQETLKQSELVGAFAKVLEWPRSRLDLMNASGYLVYESENTWKIVVLAKKKGHHSRLLVIPKRGTKVAVVIQMKPSDNGKHLLYDVVINP